MDDQKKKKKKKQEAAGKVKEVTGLKKIIT